MGVGRAHRIHCYKGTQEAFGLLQSGKGQLAPTPRGLLAVPQGSSKDST